MEQELGSPDLLVVERRQWHPSKVTSWVGGCGVWGWTWGHGEALSGEEDGQGHPWEFGGPGRAKATKPLYIFLLQTYS